MTNLRPAVKNVCVPGLRRRTASAWLLVIFILSACATPPARPNLGEFKQELITYKESGRYHAEIESVIAAARNDLTGRIASDRKLAIVLDIDETALSNWTALKANDFGFIRHGGCNLPHGPCGLGAWIEKADAPAIAPMLTFFQWIRRQRVAIFFISARPERYQTATELNLHAAGYNGWTGLYLKPDHGRRTSAAVYKTGIRRELAAKGYTIILNIGDQPSDLEGGYSDRTFLLPNPFYRIP